jgi:HEAT repeat protein
VQGLTLLRGLGAEAVEAVPTLRSCLRSADAPVRLGAARALGAIGPAAKAVVPDLGRLLGDADDEVCAEAAAALGTMGPDARSTVDGLLEALNRSSRCHENAVTVLAGLGDAALPKLIANVEADQAAVRLGCVTALGRMGPAARAAVLPLVNRRRKEKVFEVREAIERALLLIQRKG